MPEYRRILLDGYPCEVRREGDTLVAGDGREVGVDEAIHLPPTEPTKIIAVHLNYASRTEEFMTKLPPAPTYFHKPITALNSHKAGVVRPAGCKWLNYEGEIVIVIGRTCRNVSPAQAVDYIAGYSIGNDYGLHDFRDTDGGPNVLQNYPILQLVTNGGDGTTLQGFFQGRSNQTVTLEFFENQACDPAGYGEGETFLERQIITTDATGRAYLTFNRPTQLPWGHGLTATATADYAYSTTGSHPTTSEFSACRVATTLVNSALTAAIANVRYRNELVDYAPAGVYTIVALFTNHTTLPIANLAFKVATLSNGNYLLNADGHPGGVGAVLNLPVSLAPGAAQVVTFQIGLQAKVPFNFVVDAYGVLGNGAGAAESLAPGAGFAYAITAGDLAPTNGGQTQLYLPWIER